MNYFDIILLKYPGIQRVLYWQTQQDGTDWEDPYDGIVWENEEISKPTKDQLTQWMTDADILKQYTYQQNAIKNEKILAKLDKLDIQSIRALREPDATSVAKLAKLTQQAAELRAKLLPTS